MPKHGGDDDDDCDGDDGASDQGSDMWGVVSGSNTAVADQVLSWLSGPLCWPDFLHTSGAVSLCYIETWEFFPHVYPGQQIWMGEKGKEGASRSM